MAARAAPIDPALAKTASGHRQSTVSGPFSGDFAPLAVFGREEEGSTPVRGTLLLQPLVV